jgi:hypothetical protein
VAPRLTPFFFALLSIVLIGAALRQGTPWRALLPRQPALLACLVLAAYLFVNATWSLDRPEAFAKAALFLALVLMAFTAVCAASTLNQENFRRAGLAFAAGAFFGGLFILVELLTSGILTRTAMNWIPVLQPSALKRIRITEGLVTAVKLPEFNQNANLAIFHLWPGLLALTGLGSAHRTTAIVLFFATLAAVVVLSEHNSSQVALFGSSLVVVLAWKWCQTVIRALALLWCAAFIFVIPASFVAYQSELQLAEWLPHSDRARIILWEYMGRQTLRHPLLGVGIQSTPVLRDQQTTATILEQPEGHVYPRKLGHHGHDIFLQTWYELGAVGALLLALAGAGVVMLIPLLSRSAQPFAAGSFAAFAIVGAFAWGMWQTWFICAVAQLPLYLSIAGTAIRDHSFFSGRPAPKRRDPRSHSSIGK